MLLMEWTAKKARWESNINVLFTFMYFQKWNCYFQNRTIMFFLRDLHSYICERFIYFQVQSAFSATGKYVDRSWEYINRSQSHECGNWDWGRAIPRKGINTWDFPCNVKCYQGLLVCKCGLWVQGCARRESLDTHFLIESAHSKQTPPFFGHKHCKRFLRFKESGPFKLTWKI
jgi:hypothetical protein